MTKTDNDLKTVISEKTILAAQNKHAIIEHLNEEHQNELIDFAKLYLPDTPNLSANAVEQVTITQIYQQGVDVQVASTDMPPTALFIPFQNPIDDIAQLQNQYIALVQQVDKLKGKDSIKLIKQSFTVKQSHKVSDNMLRLVLAADSGVLNYVNSAGYAYLFDLTTNAVKFNQKLLREHCYYTLRKVFLNKPLDDKTHNTIKKDDTDTATVWIDIYLHKEASSNTYSSGGCWASALQAGDLVRTKREFPEKIDHLTTGQALLIADETSLPTVARLLETWQNPTAPIVISITNQQADQDYLLAVKTAKTAQNFRLLPLVINHNQTQLPEKIDALIADYLSAHAVKIDKVWGALEAKATKKLRRLLQQRLALPRTECVLKVYWRSV